MLGAGGCSRRVGWWVEEGRGSGRVLDFGPSGRVCA